MDAFGLSTHSLARDIVAAVQGWGRGSQEINYSKLGLENHPGGNRRLGRNSKASQKSPRYVLAGSSAHENEWSDSLKSIWKFRKVWFPDIHKETHEIIQLTNSIQSPTLKTGLNMVRKYCDETELLQLSSRIFYDFSLSDLNSKGWTSKACNILYTPWF